MPRQLRIEYEGALYHVPSRGDRKEAIFLDDADRHDFLKTLAEACQKTGFEVHAYCLMKNHFHLVVETPQANLVAGMRWLLSAYSLRLNHRHKLCGHVFSGRYKALVVDGSGDGYLRTVCDYTHLNPVRAKLLAPASRFLEYSGRTQAQGMEGNGVKTAGQERRGQNGAGGAIAARDHPDRWGHRAAASDGKQEELERQAAPLEKDK
jgi:REP element-mobilizing transposase RayT